MGPAKNINVRKINAAVVLKLLNRLIPRVRPRYTEIEKIEAQKRITITFNENESDKPKTHSIPAAIIGVPSPIDVPVDPNNPTMNRTSIIWPGTPSACLPNNPLQLLLILSRGILFT